MADKSMTIGIMSKQDYIKRTIAIAKGEYQPSADEPKVWFDSEKSVMQVLSADNRKLLKLIIDYRPQSLAELSKVSHRSVSNLSRTLKTMAKYKIVELPKFGNTIVPEVKATEFDIKLTLPATFN